MDRVFTMSMSGASCCPGDEPRIRRRLALPSAVSDASEAAMATANADLCPAALVASGGGDAGQLGVCASIATMSRWGNTGRLALSTVSLAELTTTEISDGELSGVHVEPSRRSGFVRSQCFDVLHAILGF